MIDSQAPNTSPILAESCSDAIGFSTRSNVTTGTSSSRYWRWLDTWWIGTWASSIGIEMIMLVMMVVISPHRRPRKHDEMVLLLFIN